MELRAATSADSPAIRDVARRSLQASYSLDADAIITAVEEWYDEQRLETILDDEDRRLLVAEREAQVVAFGEAVCSDDGEEATLLWLHVDPAYRGEHVAAAVLDRMRAQFEEGGITRIYGRVLQDNADGNEFYEAQGFERVGREEVEIAGESHVENLWADVEEAGLEPVEADGRTVYVNHAESDTGSKAHFHVVYSDVDAADRYGYFCSNCEGLANAMDAMGRIECDECGNVRKATRWDAAYL